MSRPSRPGAGDSAGISPAAGRALEAWKALNDRQRAYLQAAYELDQAHEAEQRTRWGRGQDRTPAAEWRWIEFGVERISRRVQDDTALRAKIRRLGLLDPGAGSTWQALESRGLIECRHPHDRAILSDEGLLDVRLTRAGRAACRAGRGERPSRTPKGLLSEWLWRWLCRIHAAGAAGFPDDRVSAAAQDAFSRTRQVLARSSREQVSPAPYFDLWRGQMEQDYLGPWASEYRWRLTEEGWLHYRLHWDDYRRLYPEVEALDPRRPVEDQVRELLGDREREQEAVARGCPDEVRRALGRAKRTSEAAGSHLERLEAALAPLQEALADAGAGGGLEAPADFPPDLAGLLQEPTRRYLGELRRWRATAAAGFAELAARLVDAVVAGGDPAQVLAQATGNRRAGLPRVGRIGVAELDETITRARQTASSGGGQELHAYAETLASLLTSGRLARALLQGDRPAGQR